MAKNYNPDVLNCIANLSNDEVFTPPALANQVLDMLPQELFRSPETTFLDPFTKSGVFLREIVKRLDRGLEPQIPDKRKRIDHILHRQVFGIACTELTALLSRRSVYCSKHADGKHCVSPFKTGEGNILYTPLRHTWIGGKCRYCGASQSVYDRASAAEQYAYQFIHTDNPERLFNMQFDVIIGNPPYQLSDGGGNGASATPIYNLFIDQSKKLNPRYLCMIIPARWYTGGKGLDTFRDEMLIDKQIKIIHDFPDASECFSGVQIKGGVMYFLREKGYDGYCEVYSHTNGEVSQPEMRPLLEKGCDTFIRYNIAVKIVRKVNAKNEDSFENLISVRMPYGIPNTYKGELHKNSQSDLIIYVSGNDAEHKGTVRFIPRNMVKKGEDLINCHKVFISKAGSGSDSFPHPILTKPFYGKPNTICNESYLVIGPFIDAEICQNVISYIHTKFFRFLVLQKKNSQNAAKGVYSYVPLQDFSHPWTDEMLYEKYGLTEEEIAFIESMIRPME